MNLESKILDALFDTLNDIGAHYCVMNNYRDLPDFIPSDVDISIDKDTFGVLDSLVVDLAERFDVGVAQKIWHGYRKCAYILSPTRIDMRFYLQLDFFVDFSGRGYPNLLPWADMQKGKRAFKNFYIPAPEVEAPFILQRRIFKGDIKPAHVKTLSELFNGNEDVIA